MRSRERFQEIIKVFISYGFGYIVDGKFNSHRNSPENLRKAFEELGPTFIKIGQILSTRSDILPEEYVSELKKLQDSVPKESFESIKSVFEESLNKKIEDCFIFFSKEPLASASIAQVHDAILNDGRNVVVKVQRPYIYEKMKMDISILKRIIKLSKGRLNIDVVNPLAALEELEITTEKELDFLGEGESILRFRENNKDVPPIYAPEVVEYLLSDKVITLENINGFKINDTKAIKREGYDNKEIAKKLALSYCKQIFSDGFFHGDPHPGNLLISEGKICFIDFGITGELDEGLKRWLNTAMLAVATGDKSKLVDFILAIGIKAGRINRGALYEDVSYLFTTYLNTSLKNIKMAVLLEEVFNIAQDNNIQFPRELVVLLRGLVILEGVVAEVDPELNIISVITSFVKAKNKSFLLNEFNEEEILLSTYAFLRDGVRIPGQTLELLNRLVEGRTKVNLSIPDLNNTVSNISNMVNRLVGALLISSIIIASSLIISSNVGPIYRGLSLIGVIGYFIAAIFAITLLIAVIREGGFRSKKKK